ncbi:MAG: TlpA family protein disulfide reductase [Acidobacteriaceae bacterium]|jgi:thiol-disulfide isomerase/thioredoxin|nr:TlpA family protein disulfide reductase [Acidobacteriaceae bacterium]
MKIFSRGGAVLATVAVTAGLLMAGCSGGKNASPEDTRSAASSGDDTVLTLLTNPALVADVSMTDLDGKTISMASLKGKVVLVNFWATWCPPCREEIPDLVELQNKYRDRLVVLGISEDEAGVDVVKAFAAEHKMNYPIVMVTPELEKIFSGVTALPTTFVVDPDGRIQQRHTGMLNAELTVLETDVLSGHKKNVRIERVDDPHEAMLRNAAQAKEIPGVDLSKMTPAARTAALAALNADNCTCGCGLTLAACRINDPSCDISLPLARALAEKVAKEQSGS